MGLAAGVGNDFCGKRALSLPSLADYLLVNDARRWFDAAVFQQDLDVVAKLVDQDHVAPGAVGLLAIGVFQVFKQQWRVVRMFPAVDELQRREKIGCLLLTAVLDGRIGDLFFQVRADRRAKGNWSRAFTRQVEDVGNASWCPAGAGEPEIQLGVGPFFWFLVRQNPNYVEMVAGWSSSLT